MATAKKTADPLKGRAEQAKKAAGTGSDEKSYKYPEGWKEPKSLAAGADLLWQLQQKRSDAQKVADAIEAQEKAVKNWLIDNLPKSDASGVAGKLCRVTAVRKEVPRVEDWSKVYAGIVSDYQRHAKKKDGQQDGAFSLLQRRLGEGAVKEMWEAGLAIDGVGKFTAVTLSVNKV